MHLFVASSLVNHPCEETFMFNGQITSLCIHHIKHSPHAVNALWMRIAETTPLVRTVFSAAKKTTGIFCMWKVTPGSCCIRSLERMSMLSAWSIREQHPYFLVLVHDGSLGEFKPLCLRSRNPHNKDCAETNLRNAAVNVKMSKQQKCWISSSSQSHTHVQLQLKPIKFDPQI